MLLCGGMISRLKTERFKFLFLTKWAYHIVEDMSKDDNNGKLKWCKCPDIILLHWKLKQVVNNTNLKISSRTEVTSIFHPAFNSPNFLLLAINTSHFLIITNSTWSLETRLSQATITRYYQPFHINSKFIHCKLWQFQINRITYNCKANLTTCCQ